MSVNITNSGYDLDPPTNPVVAVPYPQTGSMTSGSYRYKATFVTAFGETTPSPASALSNTTSGAMLLTLPITTDNNVISRKIYRTIVGGGGAYKLLYAINNNFEPSFIDIFNDSVLGADAPVINTASSVQTLKGWLGLSNPSASSVASNITATGTTQVDALQLSKENNIVTTTPINSGVVLPALFTNVIGMHVTVTNKGVNTLKIYPFVNQTINDGVINLPYSAGAGLSIVFIADSSINWKIVSITGIGVPLSSTLSTASATPITLVPGSPQPGPNYTVKGLLAGTGISLSQNATDVTVTNSATIGNSGFGQPLIDGLQIAPNYVVKGIAPGFGTSIVNSPSTLTINNTTNLSSAGAGVSLVNGVQSGNMLIKSLQAGGGIVLVDSPNNVTIATGPLFSSVGDGNHLLYNENNQTFAKSIKAGQGISIKSDEKTITIASESPISSVGYGASLIDNSKGQCRMKGLSAGSGVSLKQTPTDIIIETCLPEFVKPTSNEIHQHTTEGIAYVSINNMNQRGVLPNGNNVQRKTFVVSGSGSYNLTIGKLLNRYGKEEVSSLYTLYPGNSITLVWNEAIPAWCIENIYETTTNEYSVMISIDSNAPAPIIGNITQNGQIVELQAKYTESLDQTEEPIKSKIDNRYLGGTMFYDKKCVRTNVSQNGKKVIGVGVFTQSMVGGLIVYESGGKNKIINYIDQNTIMVENDKYTEIQNVVIYYYPNKTKIVGISSDNKITVENNLTITCNATIYPNAAVRAVFDNKHVIAQDYNDSDGIGSTKVLQAGFDFASNNGFEKTRVYINKGAYFISKVIASGVKIDGDARLFGSMECIDCEINGLVFDFQGGFSDFTFDDYFMNAGTALTANKSKVSCNFTNVETAICSTNGKISGCYFSKNHISVLSKDNSFTDNTFVDVHNAINGSIIDKNAFNNKFDNCKTVFLLDSCKNINVYCNQIKNVDNALIVSCTENITFSNNTIDKVKNVAVDVKDNSVSACVISNNSVTNSIKFASIHNTDTKIINNNLVNIKLQSCYSKGNTIIESVDSINEIVTDKIVYKSDIAENVEVLQSTSHGRFGQFSVSNSNNIWQSCNFVKPYSNSEYENSVELTSFEIGVCCLSKCAATLNIKQNDKVIYSTKFVIPQKNNIMTDPRTIIALSHVLSPGNYTFEITSFSSFDYRYVLAPSISVMGQSNIGGPAQLDFVVNGRPYTTSAFLEMGDLGNNVGQFKLGADGTPISKIKFHNVSGVFPVIGAKSSILVKCLASGVNNNDNLFISNVGKIPDGVIVSNPFASDNSISVMVSNITNSNLTGLIPYKFSIMAIS